MYAAMYIQYLLATPRGVVTSRLKTNDLKSSWSYESSACQADSLQA